MELLNTATEEIKRLTPHQLIALNSIICLAAAKDVTVKYAANTVNVVIPQRCLDSIEAFLKSTEADYLVLSAIVSDLIIKSFNFLGLLAAAKDFMSLAEENDIYQQFLKSENIDYDFTLAEARSACNQWSDTFHSWLTGE
ncbi:hypothetical protein JYQ62_02170 [Nostoc sp. UHCC 0702]|nr:hypothetical protein JYQ62_02170 [Nostoc sp. UHCC 0702]